MRKTAKLLCAAMLLLGGTITAFGQSDQEEFDGKFRDQVEINADDLFDSDDAILGAQDAEYTIVEFIDYRAEYCRANHEVLAKYLIENSDTRVVIKHFPILGEESRIMAETALAVFKIKGQEAFAKVHDAFLAYGGPVNEQVLHDLIWEAGIDASSVTELRRSSREIQLLLGSVQRLARLFEIQVSPSFISERFVLRGFLSEDAIDEFIGRQAE